MDLFIFNWLIANYLYFKIPIFSYILSKQIGNIAGYLLLCL
ncbi:MAG: hypothetical protein JWP78_495 [Mucilaginibacter sp.]|nr:hypothetical protein [Mucilaginibacter sp.]